MRQAYDYRQDEEVQERVDFPTVQDLQNRLNSVELQMGFREDRSIHEYQHRPIL